MARFCPNCGQPVTENEQFCHQCGSPLQTSVDSQPTVDSQPADRLRANTPVLNTGNISIVDECKNPQAILLKSAAPLPRKAAWIKWGYIISLIAAPVTLGVGLLFLLLFFAMDNFVISYQKGKIRRLKFKFRGSITPDNIFARLQPALISKYGNAISFDRDGNSLSVEYDSIIYDINLNDDNTFSIWWRKSLAGAIFSFNEFKLYKKVRIGTPMIAYELQRQFNIQ